VIRCHIFDIAAAEVDVLGRIGNFLASADVFDEVADVLFDLTVLQRQTDFFT
jgi:hypothetical protein